MAVNPQGFERKHPKMATFLPRFWLVFASLSELFCNDIEAGKMAQAGHGIRRLGWVQCEFVASKEHSWLEKEWLRRRLLA